MKKYLLFLCILFTVAPTFQSCKLLQPIQITSPFSAELVRDINFLGMQYDGFSARIEGSADKTFDTYDTDYSAMEILSNSIVARVEVMPKSGVMLRQAKFVQDMLLNYKDRHKTRIKLNDSEIRTNRVYFRDQLKPLLVSSMALK